MPGGLRVSQPRDDPAHKRGSRDALLDAYILAHPKGESPLPPRFLVSCGEPSGDLYGAELVHHLRAELPDLEVFGLGGDGLVGERASLVAHVRDLAVVGLVEVVRHLGRLRRIFRQVLDEVDRRRPDLCILIDYAGFNLRLAKELHERGLPIVYYVSPQVWAWRRRRVHTIRRTVERMLVLFPFEPAFYAEHGVNASFVGHPLVDRIHPVADPAATLSSLGLDPARPLVTLLPGSRTQEIHYNLPPLAGAVSRIAARRPDVQFALALADNLAEDLVRPALAGLPVTAIRSRTRDLLGSAAVGLVASGTATVEAALLGTPMVVVYRVSPLSYALGKPFVNVPHYAMANLIAGKRLVTELIQGDFTPDRVAAEALLLLDDPARREAVRDELLALRQRLGGGGASARASQEVLAVWREHTKKVDNMSTSM